MPKQMILMRHAKSSWADGGLADSERPLNGRGRRDAPEMGRLLAAHQLVPDLLFCSTSQRTRETLELLLPAWQSPPEIHFRDDLYLAPSARLMEVIRTARENAARLMILAHNDGLADLVSELASAPQRFPTAAIAVFDVELANWSDFPGSRRSLQLQYLWRPKQL